MCGTAEHMQQLYAACELHDIIHMPIIGLHAHTVCSFSSYMLYSPSLRAQIA